MSHIVPIPPRLEIRLATDACISRWARTRNLRPRAVHRLVHRYGGKTLDMSRIWGLETRAILFALVEVVAAADIPRPASPGGDPESPAGGRPASADSAPADGPACPVRGGPSTASPAPAGGGDPNPSERTTASRYGQSSPAPMPAGGGATRLGGSSSAPSPASLKPKSNGARARRKATPSGGGAVPTGTAA